MPIWGTGPKRTDGQTNFQIRATPYTQLPANYPRNRSGGPIMGYRFLPYTQVVSNYGLWFDAMDTSTIRDLGGNFPPLLPPNQRGIGQWNDKSGNNRHLSNFITQPAQFNLMSPGTFYPVVFATGGASRLRLQTTPASFTGISISAFFVLSLPTTSYVPAFNYTSSFDAMPIPTNPNGPNPSTFDFSLRYLSNTIGFSRHGGVNNTNTAINVISAPFSTNTTTLVSIFVNGSQTTIGSVLPSTNLISINGSFVSSSTTYAGNPFNFQWISMFSGYNFSYQVPSFFNEVGIFFRTLTTPERVAYESQLIKKWGLQSNAPISYINSLPVSSGLFGWYDAYDQTTVLRNSSNNVSMWLDKSGQNNHMSTNLLTFGSNTGSNIYYSSISISTNQFPSLFFPSTFAFMQTSTLITNQNLSSITMIAVKRGIKIPNGPQPRTVSLFSTLDGLELGGGIIGAQFDSIQNNTVANTQLAANFREFHINTLVGNIGPSAENGVASGNAVSYYNGTNAQTTTGLSYIGNLYPSYIRLMSGAFNDQANGDPRADAGFLGEVLIYNRILNTTELSNTHAYLLNKWGISVTVSNLPVTSGLNLWLDCYDPATIFFSTNTNQVTQWRDKSLCNLHMCNTGTLAPSKLPTYTVNSVNNLPGLQFSNNTTTGIYTNLWNSNFTYPVVREATIFAVFQANSGNNSYYNPIFTMLLSNQVFFDNANGFCLSAAGAGNQINSIRSTPGIAVSVGNTLNIPALATAVYNSSFTTIPDIPQNRVGIGRNGVIGATSISSFISTIGNSALSTHNFVVNQASIGTRGAGAVGDATWYNSGFIHEVILYNRALTFIERQAVESYLMSKWNI